jgi:8-oxo-dGTP diphosphatase
LLGLKKIGLGAGKYAGFGGKLEADEALAMAAVRELR